jgi:hypothetical protein
MHKSRYQRASLHQQQGVEDFSVAWFEKTHLMLTDKERPTEVVLGGCFSKKGPTQCEEACLTNQAKA